MVIIDTDLIVEALRGRGDAVAKVRALKEACITSITAFELLRGVYLCDDPQAERERTLELIEALFVIDFTYIDADYCGKLSAQLTKTGTPIGTMDTMIAATCLATGQTLVTRNAKHFEKIPGLRVETW